MLMKEHRKQASLFRLLVLLVATKCKVARYEMREGTMRQDTKWPKVSCTKAGRIYM